MNTKINETRVFGPPGTGKTRYASQQIEYAAEQFGPESVIVASFTKAAAKELIGRGQPIPDDQIGTLHAHCYRLIGKPDIAESKTKEFNEEYPQFSVTPTNEIRLDDGLSGAEDMTACGSGDEFLAQMNIYRARMIPRELWLPGVVDFSKAWEGFKKETGYLDFQDLIEVAGKDYFAPKGATIGVFDEVQDFTPAQLKLIRSWAKQMHWTLMCGDDDQTLYSFTGATPEAFLNPPIPDEQKRILKQSYRVPSKVLRLANTIVSKLSIREPNEYRPRDHEGAIYTSNATWKHPDNAIKVVKKFMAEDKSVMILASCSYLLGPTLSQLRAEGIPFSNIYKATRGDWNPIRRKQTGNAGSFGRLCAYMEPGGPEFQGVRLWTPEQLLSWSEVIKAEGNFKRGAKKALKEACADKFMNAEKILAVMLNTFEDEAFDNAIAGDIDWFTGQLTPAKIKSFDFPEKVYRSYGSEGIDLARKLTVGTIHSVKGAEADVVILFPDLSLRGAQGYALRSGENFEQILRQFYVAVTRTRDVLVLCQGMANGMFFKDYK
jgi:superfamily I DNA/RNA helicase